MNKLVVRQAFFDVPKLFGLENWKALLVFDRGEAGRPDIVCRPDPISSTVKFYINELGWYGIHLAWEAKLGREFTEPEIAWICAVHEWAHLIVNRYSGVLAMEEIQVSHITRACVLLKFGYIGLLDTDSEGEIFTKAYELAWLDENDWRVRIEETSDIHEERSAYARSLQRENHGHYGSLGAKEAILYLDRELMSFEGLTFKDAALREMFRIVLNSFGDSLHERMMDRKLWHIMLAMNQLGW